MKRYSTEIKKFVFFTEEPFIVYFGKNYESVVLQANRNCIPVIRIVNASGTHSAVPLERANSLLEKYYKIMDRQAKEVYHANLDEMTPIWQGDEMLLDDSPKEATIMSGAA